LSRVPRYLVDPEDPQSIVQQSEEIQRVVDGDIEFGHPNDPEDITSTTPAGSTSLAHNGNVQNIAGSWVEAKYTSANSTFTCYHNLFPDPEYTLPVTGEPNVRWLVFGFSHDGNTIDAASTLSVDFVEGDTVAANSIQLRLHAAGTRVVDATHPVTVTLFFIPAVRAPLE